VIQREPIPSGVHIRTKVQIIKTHSLLRLYVKTVREYRQKGVVAFAVPLGRTMQGMRVLTILLTTLSLSFRATFASKLAPTLPLQFTATVKITAHRVDKDALYPPYLKILKVAYDQPNGRFKAVEENRYTHEAMRFTIRRYDQGREFQVIDTTDEEGEGPFACIASKIKDSMPLPEWPSQAIYEGTEPLNGVECDLWREDFGTVEISIYFNAKTGAPVRVEVETIEQTQPVRLTTPDLTFDWSDFRAGEPKDKFQLPFAIEDVESTCQWQPNNVGFPYMHIFHFYYRV